MRKDNKANDEDMKHLCGELSKLCNLNSHLFQHIIYLYYFGLIHEVACEAKDSDKRLNEVSIEIPFIGKLTFSIGKDSIEFKSIDTQNYFDNELFNAATEGIDPLTSRIKEKFIETIKERYKELV